MPVHLQGTKIGECTVYSTNFLRSFYPTILFILFFIYPIISSSNYYHNCPSLLFSVNSGSSRSQTQILNCFLFIFFFFYPIHQIIHTLFFLLFFKLPFRIWDPKPNSKWFILFFYLLFADFYLLFKPYIFTFCRPPFRIQYPKPRF